MDLLITSVNEADVGFKLDTCKLQKNHAKYGEGQVCDDDEQNQQLLQLDEEQDTEYWFNLGQKKKKFGVKGDLNFQKAISYAQQWQHKYSSAQEIPDEEIPETHDFRNIEGYDFTNSHRDQGACGSCYTMGFI